MRPVPKQVIHDLDDRRWTVTEVGPVHAVIRCNSRPKHRKSHPRYAVPLEMWPRLMLLLAQRRRESGLV